MNEGLHQAGEDYLEAILQLQKNYDEVRSVDVANTLGVSRPSVNKAIGVLKEKGFVKQEHYGSIKLTDDGYNYAIEIMQRHTTIKRFLTDILKVENSIADSDACKMEHAVSRETMLSMTKYLQQIMGENL
ncbi:MAG: metal-dependent transcriptional regulator [Oscillospiraceae bacterium]